MVEWELFAAKVRNLLYTCKNIQRTARSFQRRAPPQTNYPAADGLLVKVEGLRWRVLPRCLCLLLGTAVMIDDLPLDGERPVVILLLSVEQPVAVVVKL